MAMEHYEIEFTRDGRVFDEGQVQAALAGVSGLTDLIILSHGWNNDKADARTRYEELTQNLEAVIEEEVISELTGRQIGIMRIFWPSKKFADEDLIPGGGAASATIENSEALQRLLEEMKWNPETLGGGERDPVRENALTEAQALAPQLEADAVARERFVLLLRSVLDPDEAHHDDGSLEFFTLDPQAIFEGLSREVVAPGGSRGSGATSVGSGGAARLGDFFGGIQAAARRIANFTTYYEMKHRSGVVGRTGLAPVLQRLRDRYPDLRLHLVGHSFGGRLVTAAAHAMPKDTPRLSLCLLQAAFSHNGLAQNYDNAGADGAFRAVLSERRASGPIAITYTKNDQAVGIAYPLASRIARQVASMLGDEDDPYGGMGRNGAQHTPEAQSGQLEEVGYIYGWQPGRVYNLKADSFISGHSEVWRVQVANAILNAVSAVQP